MSRAPILTKEQWGLLSFMKPGRHLYSHRGDARVCHLCLRVLGNAWREHLRSHWDAAEEQIRAAKMLYMIRGEMTEWSRCKIIREVFGCDWQTFAMVEWWHSHPADPPGVWAADWSGES